jgi:hypothetical protein
MPFAGAAYASTAQLERLQPIPQVKAGLLEIGHWALKIKPLCLLMEKKWLK